MLAAAELSFADRIPFKKRARGPQIYPLRAAGSLPTPGLEDTTAKLLNTIYNCKTLGSLRNITICFLNKIKRDIKFCIQF